MSSMACDGGEAQGLLQESELHSEQELQQQAQQQQQLQQQQEQGAMKAHDHAFAGSASAW